MSLVFIKLACSISPSLIASKNTDEENMITISLSMESIKLDESEKVDDIVKSLVEKLHTPYSSETTYLQTWRMKAVKIIGSHLLSMLVCYYAFFIKSPVLM